MKFWAKLVTRLLITAILPTTAFAGGFGGLFAEITELPDPSVIMEIDPVFYGDDIIADEVIYCGYTFPMPENIDQFIIEYTMLAIESGYTVTDAVIGMVDGLENVPAWQVSAGLMNAYIIPEFRGCMLLLVNPMMDFSLLPTPEPTPVPTPKPTPRPVVIPSNTSTTNSSGSGGSNNSNGHWEYIEVQQDCFACFGGICDLCDGSGIYRMYGSEVPCSTYCETCDGLGYWYVTQPVWVQ